MRRHLDPAAIQLERAEQQKLLNFDWTRKDSATMDKIQEYADSIYERVTMEVTADNPIPYFFDVKPGEAGKKVTFKRSYGGKVYNRAYGEYKKISSFKSKYYTVTTSPKAVHMSWPVEDIKMGIVLTSEIVQMARDAILWNKIHLAWETLKDAIPTSDAENTGTTLTQPHVLTVVKALRDVCTPVAIVGRYSFLGDIITFSGYDGQGQSQNMKQEIDRSGWVGNFAGVPVYGIQEMEDEMTGEDAVDASNIFVIGDKGKKWNRWSEVTPVTSSQEVVLSDGTWHLYYDFEEGLAIWETKYMKRIWDGV